VRQELSGHQRPVRPARDYIGERPPSIDPYLPVRVGLRLQPCHLSTAGDTCPGLHCPSQPGSITTNAGDHAILLEPKGGPSATVASREMGRANRMLSSYPMETAAQARARRRGA